MRTPLRVLAIKLREIGDTVIWTSTLQALHARHPEAEIHVLTYKGNAEVLRHHPAVHTLHLLRGSSRWELIRTLFKLRAKRFDYLLGFNANTSLCRWAWLAGAEEMALHHFSWPYTPRGSLPVPHAAELEDAITRDHRVLEAIGIFGAQPPTQIFLTEDERTRAETRMAEAIRAVGGDPARPRWVFLPGARHPLHRYPKDLWLPLAERLAAGGRYQPVVLVDHALSRELDLANECARLCLPLIDQCSLREFMALIGTAQRAFANDSAPGHIAVALGVQTDFVFGPGCPGDWHPYDRRRHPLHYRAVDCRARGPRDRAEFQFCTVATCEHHRCLRELKIELN